MPGGQALTVDREVFAREVSRAIEGHPRIELRRAEATSIDPDSTKAAITIVATGPLTSGALAEDIGRHTGAARLFFYDSISPIVEAESIDLGVAFRASRYGKSLDGTDDYLNCPLDREQYERFVDAILAAEAVPSHIPEDSARFFEACLPIEELARRGRETLRFGPMKPMGLEDPRTGRRPYAVVQLRQENLRAASFNLVGFQNHMRFAEQARVLRMIPGLERAEFLRYGQIHRNTYINAPALLTNHAPASDTSARILRWTDLGRGRVRGIHRDRAGGGTSCRGVGGERRDSGVSTRDGHRVALRLCIGRGCAQLSARQYHV